MSDMSDKEHLTIFVPVDENGKDDKDGKFLRGHKKFVDGTKQETGIFRPVVEGEEFDENAEYAVVYRSAENFVPYKIVRIK